MSEDTVQRLMGLAREAIRSAVLSETRGGRNYEQDADEDLEALESALREALMPAGWKLVPVEPTMEMLYAADASDREYSARNFGLGTFHNQSGYDHWVAMLSAAPSAFPAEAPAPQPKGE